MAARRLPKLSNPDEAPIVAAVWSQPEILGHPPYTSDDLDALMQINQIETNIGMTYAFFRPQPDAKPDQHANVIAYQDELVATVIFNDAAYAALIDALTDYLAKHDVSALPPEVRAKFADVRRLIGESTKSLIGEMEAPIRSDNVDRLIAAFVAHAPTFAAAVTPADRRDIVKLIETASRSLSRDRRNTLQAGARAMNVAGCAGLCAVE